MNTNEYKIDLLGYKKYLGKKDLSNRSVETYVTDMQYYSKTFNGIFSYYNNRELVEADMERKKTTTVNKLIIAINSYIKYLKSQGEEDLDEWFMSTKTIKAVQFLDDVISMADYEFVLKKAVASKKFLIYLYARIAGTTGMRLCEMLQIKREHIEHGSVDLYGKGVKRRRIYFAKNMREDVLKLLDYLGLTSGYVFSPSFRGEKPYASHGRYIQQEITNFGRECELPEGLLHTHGFRHFFAKEFIRRNQNIALLADLLGHSSLNTTRIYLKLTSREQAEVLDETVTW